MMENIDIDATQRTPAVDFDFAQGRFRLAGESYPEDAAAFFGPLQQALREFAGKPVASPLVFDLQMDYFNSSSAKALMNMFLIFENMAAQGAEVTVNWWYHADDDTMLESGEDFAEDFECAQFNLCLLE